ncbi:MAG: hypothetical protein A2Z88_05870 [Omnitrophica WOR_2 bacterium GWA2_47_8]|nr:MAG: hypothetical protein A2Z88_05870 [Omnitrophica WOR_2 bacterium GWA2_47_8]
MFVLLLLLTGCATTKVAEKPSAPAVQGVYHKVKKGETLWRIAKIYEISIDLIISSNNIPNVAQLEANQLLFIPGAAEAKDIPLDQDLNKNDFVWPVEGQILFYFGQSRRGGLSNGIDIKCHEGEMVKAARSGKVVFADYLTGYAYTVVIDHLDGFSTVYAQNVSLAVKLSDNVLKGDVIGRVGQRERLAYLHFEIRKNSKADNPLYYLP